MQNNTHLTCLTKEPACFQIFWRSMFTSLIGSCATLAGGDWIPGSCQAINGASILCVEAAKITLAAKWESANYRSPSASHTYYQTALLIWSSSLLFAKEG